MQENAPQRAYFTQVHNQRERNASTSDVTRVTKTLALWQMVTEVYLRNSQRLQIQKGIL